MKEHEDQLLEEARQELAREQQQLQQQNLGAVASTSSSTTTSLSATASNNNNNNNNDAPATTTTTTITSSSNVFTPPDYEWLHRLAKNCYRRVTPYVESTFQLANIRTADDLRKVTYDDIVKMGFTLAWRVPIAQLVFRVKWGRHHWDDEVDFELRPKTPPRPAQPPAVIPHTTPAQSRDAMTAPVELERHGFANHSIPAPRLFKRGVPKDYDFEQSVTAAATFREIPTGREDIAHLLPTDEDGHRLLALVEKNFSEVRSRPEVQELVEKCGLTDDDVRALMLYNVEDRERTADSWPVMRWIAGCLMSQRRDDKIKRSAGPLFVRIYRAQEKLPRSRVYAYRGAAVEDHKAPRNSFDFHLEIYSKTRTVSFWGPTFFRKVPTAAAGAQKKAQWFPDEVEEVIYFCHELEVVDMRPFKLPRAADDPEGKRQREEEEALGEAVYPLCPVMFELPEDSIKVGNKVHVTLSQVNHSDFAYLDAIGQE